VENAEPATTGGPLPVSRLVQTLELLGDGLVILDLGAAHSTLLFRRFPELRAAVTLVAVDAQDAGPGAAAAFGRVIPLRQAVAGAPGKRRFYRRKFAECSSFLPPRAEIVAAYGLESYFELQAVVELECATLAQVLNAAGVARVDFLKTDLEGLDFEVLSRAPEIVRQALCVQSELRFQPVFDGEPRFHEVAAYLDSLGFDLVALPTEVWKYRTPHRRDVRDGRTVWADAVFFLRADGVRERFGAAAWQPFVKQVLVARLLGLHNYAEALFLEQEGLMPPVVRSELRGWLAPAWHPLRWAARQLVRLPGGTLLLGAARRVFGAAYEAAALFQDEVIGIHRCK
jgi:hypothetical protein